MPWIGRTRVRCSCDSVSRSSFGQQRRRRRKRDRDLSVGFSITVSHRILTLFLYFFFLLFFSPTSCQFFFFSFFFCLLSPLTRCIILWRCRASFPCTERILYINGMEESVENFVVTYCLFLRARKKRSCSSDVSTTGKDLSSVKSATSTNLETLLNRYFLSSFFLAR